MNYPSLRLNRSLAHEVMSIAPVAGPPQAFEIVEFSRSRREYMNHEVGVIHQYPFAFKVTFDVKWTNTFHSKSFVDSVRNALVVSVGCAGADDEVICERTDSGKLNDHGILRFLIKGSFYRFGETVVFVHLLNSASPLRI
jgi:hypothetical protein